jgi:uncharacterized 2Fe-2S/4Fe-4S cluster protein (DUF4445 family)
LSATAPFWDARLVCLSNPLREEVGGIVDACTNFELSVHPGYMDYYTSSMFLPHTEAKTQFPEVYSRIQEAKEALKKVKNEHVEG